ncbi:MAG: ATP-dependent metallopeptidase FtsH/Yme1/Tma family protein [Deltaproteobacteria bacterium]|nr:ATP-dependent metallopeptidase FtsH/Yme1/Tma family protein [Deltaproteobacteria bacterium]
MLKQSYKTILLWVILIVMFLSIYSYINNAGKESKTIEFSVLMKKADDGAVKSVRIKGSTYTGEFSDGTRFQTYGVVGEKIVERLLASRAAVTFEKDETNSLWSQILLSWLPLLIFIVLFFFFMRQLQGGGGKAMSFGKSRAKLLSSNQKKVTFNDVAGVDEAKEELQEIIDFLKDPKKFTKLGGRIPKGVLLMGHPGTGKTLLARAIAGEAGVPFFSISGSDFVEMFVGVGASRVRDLFEQGKKNAPCIIFIDEIDAVGRHRGAGLGGGHDEREQTLNQLLVEMDGFESNDGVILIAATNRPDVLDPALLRPGRFDRRVVVQMPDLGGRLGILRVHTKRLPLAPDVDLQTIARGTPGFSGADIENLVNEAALLAARGTKNRVEMDDFDHAKDKVLMGAERKSLIISEEEKLSTAYHEAGHALVAKMLKGADPVHKVSIIPRGRALGVTQQLPKEDRYNIAKAYANNRIAIAMAGRVAEEIVFGEQTTGAGSDIKEATELAYKMVCEWGMSERLGPISYARKDDEVFLGKDLIKTQSFSDQVAQQIDEEVKKVITENYVRARQVLEQNLDSLKKLAQALIEYETLDGSEIDPIIRGEGITRARPVHRVIVNKQPETRDEKTPAPSIIPEPGPKVGEPGVA